MDAHLAKLTTLLPILAAFHHRHRNQHASSHWWSSLRQLRSSTRSLHALLAQQQRVSEAVTAQQKKSSTAAKNKARLVSRQLLARAALVRDHVVPKAYLCFSQLVADNQHAALGLLLLGVLASIHTITTAILPDQPPQPQPQTQQHSQQSPSTTTPTHNAPHPPSETPASNPSRSDADRGVTISRDTIPASTSHLNPKPKPKPTTLKEKPIDEVPRKVTSARRDAGEAPKKRLGDKNEQKVKKKKKNKGDELSSLFGSL